ncbi:tyrosine-type recombinase/integrase [Caloramator proteoclasticus]|uniref:Phage integrase, N-terminal SAM-like domain n=1 Tax=Caloramator proteoclasticus DSM 10124 TaxID=1121262 RepID=A0A1M5ATZ6_9CLOT|nr:tyrosine-type recombinase/integrase [Caloramator proteoclasticus]SHF33596.1 Phage integrase, N-terminal SAM-like domain [Caloramator proteoclasticus DSM 10124]
MILDSALKEYMVYMENREKSPKTISGYMQDLNFFKKWLEKMWNGPVYLEDIEFKDVEKFLKFLKDEKNYKPASRKRISIALKMFFKYAWKKGLCKTDISTEFENVKYVPKEREYLTEEEALYFIKEIKHPVVKVLTTTLLYTGMRISEALALRPEDVDIENGWIRINQGKGNKSRDIPICEKLERVLKDYFEWRVDSEQFFATEKTKALSVGRVQSIIKETRNRLGFKKHITPHVFRHSFASHLVKKDANIVSISKLLGHSNLKTTSIYTHTSREQLIDTIKMF